MIRLNPYSKVQKAAATRVQNIRRSARQAIIDQKRGVRQMFIYVI